MRALPSRQCCLYGAHNKSNMRLDHAISHLVLGAIHANDLAHVRARARAPWLVCNTARSFGFTGRIEDLPSRLASSKQVRCAHGSHRQETYLFILAVALAGFGLGLPKDPARGGSGAFPLFSVFCVFCLQQRVVRLVCLCATSTGDGRHAAGADGLRTGLALPARAAGDCAARQPAQRLARLALGSVQSLEFGHLRLGCSFSQANLTGHRENNLDAVVGGVWAAWQQPLRLAEAEARWRGWLRLLLLRNAQQKMCAALCPLLLSGFWPDLPFQHDRQQDSCPTEQQPVRTNGSLHY